MEAKNNEDSLKYYRDLKNSLDTAEEKGIGKGLEKEKIKVTLKALSKGYSIEEIIELTELTREQIEQIKNGKGLS